MATKAGGGGGGSSAYNSDVCTLETGSSAATGVDPYIEVEYTSASATGQTVTTTTTISGAQEKKLRLKRDSIPNYYLISITTPGSIGVSLNIIKENKFKWHFSFPFEDQ